LYRVRIVAGQYRRRKVLSPPGSGTRPIPDLLKEILFQRLEDLDEVKDRRVADLFAGTGTIGLEALSRGARSAVFVEADRRVHEVLKKNIERIGVSQETLCWRADMLRCSFRPKNVDHLLPFDLLFCDPPFAMVPKLKDRSPLFRSLSRLARDGTSAPGALLLLRTPARSDFDVPTCWKPEETWTVQEMDVHLFRRQPAISDPAFTNSSPNPEPESP
tara:strand:- start:72 stop:722 length:651 start_codon:yes stop_codon:yes gene_type:complete